MNAKPVQPFGRRGRAPVTPDSKAPRSPPSDGGLATPLPRDLVAAVLQEPGGNDAAPARRVEKVPRSYRAAILAALVVAVFNAATNATFAASTTKELSGVSFGWANMPVAVALILGALWSGGRTSALCLLIAHRLLAALEQTSLVSYMIGGGAVALVFAVAMQLVGIAPGPGGIGVDVISGVGAGLFYRLFAGTQRSAG
jgi:hypothetical protein